MVPIHFGIDKNDKKLQSIEEKEMGELMKMPFAVLYFNGTREYIIIRSSICWDV